MHAEVAARLRSDPAILRMAQRRVRGWRQDGSVHAEYVAAWQALLGRGARHVAEALETDSERMRDLRQVSPFAGVLAPRERWTIWRAASASAP